MLDEERLRACLERRLSGLDASVQRRARIRAACVPARGLSWGRRAAILLAMAMLLIGAVALAARMQLGVFELIYRFDYQQPRCDLTSQERQELVRTPDMSLQTANAHFRLDEATWDGFAFRAAFTITPLDSTRYTLMPYTCYAADNLIPYAEPGAQPAETFTERARRTGTELLSVGVRLTGAADDSEIVYTELYAPDGSITVYASQKFNEFADVLSVECAFYEYTAAGANMDRRTAGFELYLTGEPETASAEGEFRLGFATVRRVEVVRTDMGLYVTLEGRLDDALTQRQLGIWQDTYPVFYADGRAEALAAYGERVPQICAESAGGMDFRYVMRTSAGARMPDKLRIRFYSHEYEMYYGDVEVKLGSK